MKAGVTSAGGAVEGFLENRGKNKGNIIARKCLCKSLNLQRLATQQSNFCRVGESLSNFVEPPRKCLIL